MPQVANLAGNSKNLLKHPVYTVVVQAFSDLEKLHPLRFNFSFVVRVVQFVRKSCVHRAPMLVTTSGHWGAAQALVSDERGSWLSEKNASLFSAPYSACRNDCAGEVRGCARSNIRPIECM